MKQIKLTLRIFPVIFFLVTGLNIFAAHVIVAPSVDYIDGTLSPYNTLHAGDTLLFQAGSKQYIQVRNFTGSSTQPIIMMNYGGAVLLGRSFSYGIKMANCKFVHFTGTGASGIFYGFQVLQTNGDGCSEDELSTNIELDHISLDSCGLRGIVAKTDVDCSFQQTRDKFTQYNTFIHDNYINHTSNEGMYIGSSFYSGETLSCNGKDTLVYPSILNGVHIYNNTVKYTGWDGIQVGSASFDGKIYNNLVMYDSQSGTASQMSGILIGGGTCADVYDNYIYKGKGDAVESLGLGNYKIYNNVIVNPGFGFTGGPKYGIYQNDCSAVTGSTISILFNNIINPLSWGIDFASNVTSNNLIASNVVINPGVSNGYIEVSNQSNVSIKNNYEALNSNNAGFIDTTYRINSTSPLIDAGYSDNRGITTDYFGQPRPSGATYDIGICEYQANGPSIPTVTTTAVTNITMTTATSGGNVTASGGASVTARGVCWSTTANPTTSNSKTSDGTGTGAFTSNLTGLTSNTLYYVRAYATNSVGTSYGNQVTFTTLASSLPTVTTTTVSNITQVAATSGGNVTSDGGSSVTARGVCWSITANPTISNSKTSDGTGTGVYTSNITGLTANTLYYVRAYATNSAGTAYGSQVSFTTLPYALPTVTTATITNIAQTTATGGGTVTSDGGVTVTARGVCWSTTANPTTSSSFTTNGSGIGTFASSLTGLTAGTLYYVRAYATNLSGTAYGNQVTFTTLSASLPTVTTTSITNITQTTATGGGNVTSDGGSSVTARGVCWSITANPTISNSKTSDGTGTGVYTSNITGLTANTLFYVRAYATNSAGTAYGSQVSFTTLPYALPTVTTATITNIAQTTATGGGTVTSDGGITVTARGVCWSITANPTISNSKTSDGTGTGTFTSSLTGLTAGTLYYVRAYATNVSGTAYGNQVTFTTLSPSLPTVTTTSITNIAQTTATGGGNVTSDGGSSVTARGVCWSITANPTISNSKTSDGTGTGVYTSNITGLTANTLYYVRAYATNSAGTSYGSQVSFTTLAYPLPQVTTSTISNITQSTATGGGNVTSDGGTPVTARGVCWSTSANPTLSNSYTTNGTGTGSFTSNMTGLTANTLYYVRAYATNISGTSYGSQISFTTLPYPLPTVTTSTISNITQTTATGGGNVTSDGGTPVTARGVCWSTSANPTLSNSYTNDGTGTGSYASNMTGLTANTLYYVRAYATNISGTSYGSQVTFTTLQDPPPTVTTSAVTNITASTATSGGNVVSDGGAPVTARGVCWSTTANPTTSNSFTTDGTGTGSYTSNITGLAPSTLYYVRAYATNISGTSYGNQVTFTTLACSLPTVKTASVTGITQNAAVSGGKVTSDGGATVTARGVCWSTSANPTLANSHTTDGSGIGVYSSNLTGLTPNTTYYVCAYATNIVGTVYGNQLTFTTLSSLPVLTTTQVSNITRRSAVSGGIVTSYGGSNVIERGVCWSTSTNPTTANNKTYDGNGLGSYVSSIDGLYPGTIYYVRAYATNSYGTNYGDQVTFVTPALDPDSTEGIESINYGSTMILYPNPVQTALNIKYSLDETSDVEISVYDLRGVRFIDLLKHIESGSQVVTFDVSQLPDGLYVVKSHSANYDATSKFIKVE